MLSTYALASIRKSIKKKSTLLNQRAVLYLVLIGQKNYCRQILDQSPVLRAGGEKLVTKTNF